MYKLTGSINKGKHEGRKRERQGRRKREVEKGKIIDSEIEGGKENRRGQIEIKSEG
jgi:hypothetical protein